MRIQVDFVRLKSYEDTQSSGEVRVVGIDNLRELQGKVGLTVVMRDNCHVWLRDVLLSLSSLLQNVLIVEVSHVIACDRHMTSDDKSHYCGAV